VRANNLIRIRKNLRIKFQNKFDTFPSEFIPSRLDEKFLLKAIALVEEKMSEIDFNIDYLCTELSMSRSTLHRKLKSLTNQSTSEFINSIRLKTAAQLIKQNKGSISEIAYSVGFNSIPYFNVSFKKKFGTTPTDYK